MKIDLNIDERNLILDCLDDTEELLNLKNLKESKKYHNEIKRLKIKLEESLEKKAKNILECPHCGGFKNNLKGMKCECQ